MARNDATNDQLRRLVTMLGITERSKQIAHRSQIFIAAMLGDPKGVVSSWIEGRIGLLETRYGLKIYWTRLI